MSRFSYNLSQHNNSMALGGIGTGLVHLCENGLIDVSTICADSVFENALPCFFAIKSKGESGTKVKVLCDDKDAVCQNISYNVSAFDKSFTKVSFPFATKDFESSDFDAKVTLTAFSPFLPLNDTDSSIPGAFFEFEVENKSEQTKEYSLCAFVNNLFKSGENKVGCSENGAAYICMSDPWSDAWGKNANLCIATDEKYVSFDQNICSTPDEFFHDFTTNSTLMGKCKKTRDMLSCALCTHFTLEKSQKKTVRFVLSWHFPYLTSGEKTYYSQYFQQSHECASYCFLHFDRLKNDTNKFSNTLNACTMPDTLLRHINSGLECFKSNEVARLEDGTVVPTANKALYMENVYAVRYLFPKLAKHMLSEMLGNFADNQDIDEKIICGLLVKLYRDYTLDSDYEQLIENWYYIAKLCDRIFMSADKQKCTFLEKQALGLCCRLALAVKDKKRFNEYTQKYQRVVLDSSSITASSVLHADECAQELSFDFKTLKTDDVNALMAVLLRRNMTREALECIDENSFAKDLGVYSLINASNGFEYDSQNSFICFNPLMDFAKDGTYKGFFCVDTGFGYVERGIDYIEINMVYGSISVKDFKVPKLPRMVLYGGRNWKFVANKNVAELDSTLKITPDKKLTVIIDV